MPAEGSAGLEDANVDPDRLTMRRQLALANVKPRLRMTSLYYLANRYNGLVVGTGNKTELAIGYFTKYGDGGVDVRLWAISTRSAVRGLAQPPGFRTRSSAKRRRRSGKVKTDEAEIGVTYDQLDRVLASIPGGERNELIDPVTMDRISAWSRHLSTNAKLFQCFAGTQSTSVRGDNRTCLVTVGWSGRLPFVSRKIRQLDPKAVVVSGLAAGPLLWPFSRPISG